MDFSVTETQDMLRDSVSRLLRERFTFDDRKKAIAAGDHGALWRAYAELGLFGVEISEAHGGIGGGFADLAIVLEAMGRGLTIDPYMPTVLLGAALVQRAGSEAQQARLLPAVAEGGLKIALAHSEATARYETARIAASARPVGGGYVLDGVKALALGGDVADVFIVAARTSGDVADSDGITLFLVDANAPGVRARGYALMDDRSAADVTLEAVRVDADAVLGAVGQGLSLLDWALDRGAAGACCEAVGAMAALNEITTEYLKTRNQFGRPIGKFQVLQHRLADMVMAEQQARSMAYLAIDAAQNEDAAARAQAVSAAKAQIGLAARVVGRGAIQLHGGIGMTMEYVAGHYFRRLTTLEKMFGDIDHHLTRYAGE